MTPVKHIDMTRPGILYLSLVGVLLFAVFISSRVGSLIPFTLHIPYQRYVASGVLALSIVAGLLGAQRHSARVSEPWRVPQSQVLILFIVFFVLGLCALVLSN